MYGKTVKVKDSCLLDLLDIPVDTSSSKYIGPPHLMSSWSWVNQRKDFLSVDKVRWSPFCTECCPEFHRNIDPTVLSIGHYLLQWHPELCVNNVTSRTSWIFKLVGAWIIICFLDPVNPRLLIRVVGSNNDLNRWPLDMGVPPRSIPLFWTPLQTTTLHEDAAVASESSFFSFQVWLPDLWLRPIPDGTVRGLLYAVRILRPVHLCTF